MIPDLVVTIPVWIKENKRTIEMTYECVKRITSSTLNYVKVYVISNRLHMITSDDFQKELSKACPSEIVLVHQDCVSRSVAGAWNEGTLRGLSDSANLFMIMANDCLLNVDTIDNLAEFQTTAKRGNVALWSGIDIRGKIAIDDDSVTDGADFTCVMYTRDTIYKHGYFDAEFKPAYFEDNDYYARIILGGEHCRVVHKAQFFHHGSATTALEPECAQHARHWFPLNRKRFMDKWGVENPAATESDVIRAYNSRPWKDPNRPLSSW